MNNCEGEGLQVAPGTGSDICQACILQQSAPENNSKKCEEMSPYETSSNTEEEYNLWPKLECTTILSPLHTSNPNRPVMPHLLYSHAKKKQRTLFEGTVKY